MLGLLYLFLCFTTGWIISSYAFPMLNKITKISYDRGKVSISPYLLLLPTWFVTGVLALTWAVYLLAFYFAKLTRTPLFFADAIVMPIALVLFAVIYYIRRIRYSKKTSFFCQDQKTRGIELLLLLGITTLACTLMWSTFFVKEGQLFIGVSVFSDFSPHLGMIRSFSYGNNFPTAYSHYGGEDIRYHFMFQFLVGNLEFLGLRLDYAFNLPSILSFVGAFLLLYVLTVKITGKQGAGILACLFFAFRSSKSLFTYLSKIPKGTSIWKTLLENKAFIGDTTNEDWGLWNLNVYINQRHLAFGLCVMFLILILSLPSYYAMIGSIKQLYYDRIVSRKNSHAGSLPRKAIFREIVFYIKQIFFSKKGWLGKDYRTAAACGILLGSLSFFHGSIVIGTLLILFALAIFSGRRLEYVIIAVLALCLSLLQSSFFIRGSAVEAKFLFGFLAENKSIFGVASYLERLLGILPLVLLAAFCLEKVEGRYLMAAFTVPLVFAFTVSLTVDVTVNHKYVMMSCILLGIYAAAFIIWLWDRRFITLRLVAVILIVLLTSTGIYDFSTVLRKNRQEGGIILYMNDPLTNFVRKNSNSQDLYLTASTNYAINQLVFGGAMLFQGHQYYAWSAGYDTFHRDEMTRRMYEAGTPVELEALVQQNNIRFIVVEWENRISKDYVLNEENIQRTYESVYEDGEGEWKITIYDTHKPIY